MIKKYFLVSVLLILLFSNTAFDQTFQNEIKIKFPGSLNDIQSGSSVSAYKIAALLFPINPIFLLEGKKFYAGITKEFSFGIFPYGRVAAEYSLIFRKTRLNQLRFSYNFDIPLEADMAAVLLTLGAGYFTDFYKQGYFPQASFSLLVPVDDNIGINAYFKIRNTFMAEKEESDIFDISMGFATVIYF